MGIIKIMDISKAMKIKLPETLPQYPEFIQGIRRAPSRGYRLNKNQTKIALKNALRYINPSLHEKIAPEFMEELITRGRIYGYRFRPEGNIKAKPIKIYFKWEAGEKTGWQTHPYKFVTEKEYGKREKRLEKLLKI